MPTCRLKLGDRLNLVIREDDVEIANEQGVPLATVGLKQFLEVTCQVAEKYPDLCKERRKET